jgi:hypothetical protein
LPLAQRKVIVSKEKELRDMLALKSTLKDEEAQAKYKVSKIKKVRPSIKVKESFKAHESNFF